MIIDDTLEVLERIKGAVKTQLPKRSDPETQVSFKIGLEQECQNLKEKAHDALDVLLETLTGKQLTLWNEYQAIRKFHNKLSYADDPNHEPEKEDAHRRKFIADLQRSQKRQYKEAVAAKRAWQT